MNNIEVLENTFEVHELLSAKDVDIHWENKFLGFGELYLNVQDSKIIIESSEIINKESVRAIFHKLADYIADNAELNM
jgi:hypothetical protein